MSKIRRNDPCPCGSGKKYKNCCLNKVLAGQNPKLINDELNRLHQEFHSFAVNNYEQEIEAQTARFDQPALKNNTELTGVYQNGLFVWLLLNLPFMTNNRTLFDVFFGNNQLALNKQVREVFSSWQNRTPSVYEIVSADKRKSPFISLREIHSGQAYRIPFYEGELTEGMLLIGTLLPFSGYHSFLVTYIKLYSHDKEKLIQLTKDYTAENGGLKDFPVFLAEALVHGAEESHEWDDPLYEEVMQLFAEKLVERNYPDRWILKGFELWKQYCETEKPAFKNAVAQAAALEYVVRQKLRGEAGITQTHLAKIYGASPGTVSGSCRRLAGALA